MDFENSSKRFRLSTPSDQTETENETWVCQEDAPWLEPQAMTIFVYMLYNKIGPSYHN